MGLAWQQGPLAPGALGTFLVAEPLPERMLYAEPLRRRMRVMFGGEWIAQSDGVVILHEPGRYPVAYFPREDIADGVLADSERTTEHPELGATAWYAVRLGEHEAPRGAWEHTDLPAFASILAGRVAFAWHAMDAFYEEDERILGHAADAYHRIDIRQTSRHLVVRAGDRGRGRDPPPAGPLRVRVRAPLVRAPRGRRRASAHPGGAPDVLPLQGPVRLLRHRRRPDGRRGPTATPTARSTASRVTSPSSPTRSRSPSTASGSSSRPGSRSSRTGPDRGLTPEEAIAPTMP